MSDTHAFFAAAPRGIEPLLAAELQSLGAQRVNAGQAGVSFAGPLALGYRVCLWSRLASRVLLPLARFPAPTPEALYEGVCALRWDQHLAPDGTLAVHCHSAQSALGHSHFAALKVKDAIVDQFRDRHGVRPSVQLERPQLRINLYLFRDEARLSLDLSGESLHRRGYREQGVAAPLKENLAAAILLRAGWPEVAAAGGPLLDPMCGSGTLPIEAALLAGDVAPGLLRDYYGFLGWRQHQAPVWADLLEEARIRRAAGLGRLPAIVGYDADAGAVRAALANVERAGLRGRVHIERRALGEACAPGRAPGLLVANPPYGERLGARNALTELYGELGVVLREQFQGWRAAVFTGNPPLAQRIGLRSRSTYTLYNGTIECKLLNYEVRPERYAVAPTAVAPSELPASPDAGASADLGVEMFANRLRKNLRNLGRWAARAGVDCYRLYDADLPDYALAIDLYQGAERWVHVQEYEAPRSVDPAKATLRLQAALPAIAEVLALDPAQVYLKLRRRQRGDAQYQKLGSGGAFHEVREGNCRLLVNFSDYLDTGLFLDHRLTRALVQSLAAGRRFLNLFAYTGSATVHAARGGALATTSVDLSATYLEWARRNLALNGFDGPGHRLVQADCLDWLRVAIDAGQRFDLIFLDPPTFSNSKRMQATFDVQRDHVTLIDAAAQLLAPGGVLIFSTNARRFRLDEAALAGLVLQDITRETLPQDFARNPRIHQCWKVTRAPTARS